MSILKVIESYDLKQRNHIRHLEDENARLYKQVTELTDLLMAQVSINERKQLQLIMAGHFDNLKKPRPEESHP